MLQIEKGQDIKQELLHRYKTILPDELIKIWEDNGLARLMGEYLKAVNPEDYQELLKETYFRGNISIPILVTAFGDIVTFEEGQYIGMVKYKNGNFVMLAKNFKRFIQNLGDDYFLEKYFQIPQYIEAVNKLGKLEQITDLRSVWKHEAKDFTPWLAKEENLEILSEAVGIDIVVEEQESNVGDFSVDLFATEEGTGRRIIIENQIEETNHDHLGKIITYASGKEAEVIIWIVRKARDEHKQAIEWLNQHTDDKFEFFLIEIELWKINDSEPAPKFNIVERPNTWAKAMKKTAALSETENLKLAFWEKFNNEAPKHSAFIREFKLRKPQAQHWYDLGLGSSAYHLCMTLNTKNNCLSAGLYVNEDKDIITRFKSNEELVSKILGIINPNEIEWRLDENKKASRFLILHPMGDMNDKDNWDNGCAWLCDMCVKIKQVVKEILK